MVGDIDDELRFHLSERVEELVAQGVSADEAARQAIAEFGDVEGVRQRLRSIDTQRQERRRRADRWQVIQQELGHAWRRVVRAPGFAVPAVATLALGLAATTTVYALLDAVVLRPLPFPHGERLVSLSSPMPKINDVWGIARHQMFYYLQNAHTMESMALYRSYDASVAQEGDGQPAERVAMANVSASIFEVLGIRAHLGRTLTPDDNLPRTANAVMLGYEFWSRRFGADPSVVGRTIQVDGYPVRVVGVAARGATLPDQRIDVWFPDHIDPAMPAINNHARSAVARLRPGYTASDLEHELAPLVLRMEEVFPQAYPDHWIVNSGFRTAVVPLRDEVVGATVTRALWIVLAAVGIVLLIAVANVVNLCIVRADARRREVAVRRALGAGQWQLAVHHAAEATVITAVAGLLAAGLSAGALRVFHWVAPHGLPRAAEVTFGWRGAGVVFVAAVFVAALLSAVTAAHARRDLSALRDGGRALTASRARLSLRGSLVGGQLALALVLLACAALMFRSFETLRRVRTGFEANGVTTMVVALPDGRYTDDFKIADFHARLQERVAAVPGVEAVSLTSRIPLEGKGGVHGRADGPAERRRTVLRVRQHAAGGARLFRHYAHARCGSRAHVGRRDNNRARGRLRRWPMSCGPASIR
ncbi:MAG: ABC transporter permease [Gemmatimonadaceae bacterium]